MGAKDQKGKKKSEKSHLEAASHLGAAHQRASMYACVGMVVNHRAESRPFEQVKCKTLHFRLPAALIRAAAKCVLKVELPAG